MEWALFWPLLAAAGCGVIVGVPPLTAWILRDESFDTKYRNGRHKNS